MINGLAAATVLSLGLSPSREIFFSDKANAGPAWAVVPAQSSLLPGSLCQGALKGK